MPSPKDLKARQAILEKKKAVYVPDRKSVV
jgi:hypothetical protein